MSIPNSYKELFGKNPKLECLKWDQYYSHTGTFKIDDIEIKGDFNNIEFEKCFNDIDKFLENYRELIEYFGTQVTVKITNLNSVEIKENNKV